VRSAGDAVCMSPIVKAKRPAEFLLALPRMLGYTPAQSILVQTFVSRRTAASLRVDLPASDEPGVEHGEQRMRAAADAVMRLISRVPGVDAVLLVVYTEEPASTEGMPPRAELIQQIVSRMASAGLGIIDALHTSGDSWVSYLDSERGSLSALEAEELRAQLDECEPSGARLRQSQGAAPIEPASDHDRGRVLEAVQRLTRDERERDRLWEPQVALRLWSDASESVPVELPTEVVAALLWSLRDKGVRDCALMQLVWGIEAGESAARDTENLRRGTPVPHGSVLETFVGEGRAAPNALRIEAAVRMLRHLVSLAPQPWQLAPLTLLAWLEWARGSGSSAGDYLDQALGIGPGYELARLFQQMIGTGRVPDWVGRAPF
jgi:hypothetical protein